MGGVEAFFAWLAPYIAVGGSAGGGFMAVKWLLEFLANRWDKKEEAIDAATQKLIANLEARLDSVTKRLDQAENDLAECKRMHAAKDAEVLQLKAMMQGYGDARNLTQIGIAAKRKAK